MLPPAGWHPDPHDPRFYRWWDGRQWTSATHPRAESGATQAPTAADSASVPERPSKDEAKRWKLPVAVLAIVAISSLGLIVVTNGDNTRSTSSERTAVAYTPPSTTVRTSIARQPIPTTPTAPAPAPAVVIPPPAEPTPAIPVGIGKPYRDGKFEFIVHSWDGSTASITIRNIGDRPQTVSTSSMYLIDSSDRKFEPEFDWTSDLVLASLNPGQSVSGNLTYVLSGATASHLELHDSMFSGGVDVPLR